MTAPHPALLRLVSSAEAYPLGDEHALLRSAHEHRMTACLLKAYEQGAIGLSTDSVTTLGVWDLAERRQHLRLWGAIREVLQRLDSTGAGVAVIKGVATEARWYDAPGQRVATDVDMLLAPDVLDDAAALVAIIDPDRGMSAAIDWLVRRRLLQHVDLRVGAVQVDLHFDPLKIGIPTLQLDEVWRSTQLLDTPHGTIRVVRPEIELVLLLLHLNKDSFAFLGSFLDIRQIISRGSLDWDYVQGFVAEEGLTVPVFKSLAAVTEVLGLEIDIPRPNGLRAHSWDWLWGPDTRLGGEEGRLSASRRAQQFLALHASGRTRHVAREARRRLLPPRQLPEVAGVLKPGESYARHLLLNRLLRRDRSDAARAAGWVEMPGRRRRENADSQGIDLKQKEHT